MPYTPYNPHTNPSIYLGPPVPPKPVTPLKPWTKTSGVEGGLMGNLPAPAYGNGGYPPPPAPPAAAGGGGPAADLWNGMRVLQRSPGGNVLVDENGVPTAYDPWGNKIPHLYAGIAGGDPNGGGGGGGGAPSPAAPTVPTPPQQTPPTFYAPTTGSPYLQFGNLAAYMNDIQRQQLNDVLKAAGFQSTGTMNAYGLSDYLRPAQFDETDLAKLAGLSPEMRQWMRFYLGNLGWGSSYQLPAGYVPGSGLPTPPPNPLA